MVGLQQLLADYAVQYHLAHTLERDGCYGAVSFVIETSCHQVGNPGGG